MTTTQAPSRVPAIDDWNQLLAGRVAVVTGGGTGIGGAIARLFARHGAHVGIAEIDLRWPRPRPPTSPPVANRVRDLLNQRKCDGGRRVVRDQGMRGPPGARPADVLTPGRA